MLQGGKQKLAPLHVDAANGVGAIAIRGLLNAIGADLTATIVNDDINDPAKLNHDVSEDQSVASSLALLTVKLGRSGLCKGQTA